MAKPDNRQDNVEKLQTMKKQTEHNIEAAEEALEYTDSNVQRQAIKAKNERRENSIHGFDEEISDEMNARTNGFKE
ncbi:small acid-soluble spore protein Tlp [Bacillus solitudinis]|uniref:small acid-soluble spore protein Tlp n=1 Tax=Bacillus solitudinis TaxID=2014074 RepID=UPI000C2311C9|nr:small acid-soluble spore protein Tlp [Bacillus solitudinis]